MELTGLTPLIQVFDMNEAIRFYRDQLGFEVVDHSPEIEAAEGRYFHWCLLRHGPAMNEDIEHRRKVEDIIDFLEIQAIRKIPVGKLPYGLQKRVELGRALAMEPELLLLDEPMAGMNLEEKEDMCRFILDVNKTYGTTKMLQMMNTQNQAHDQQWRHKKALAGGGSLPDLRYSSAATHARFVEIVVGGERADRGKLVAGLEIAAQDARRDRRAQPQIDGGFPFDHLKPRGAVMLP